MTVKIRTEDVIEILDTKILASAAQARLNVSAGESYDSVLAKIALRSPSLDERDALDAAILPSGSNRYVTENDMLASVGGAIPWKIIGPYGSDSDFEDAADNENAFLAAFASPDTWFYVKPGTFTFTAPVTIPQNVRLVGGHTQTVRIIGSFVLSDNSYISYLTATSAGADPALDASGTTGAEIRNCILDGTSTLEMSGATDLSVSDTALMTGAATGTGVQSSQFSCLYVDAPTTNAFDLEAPEDIALWGSTFIAGTLRVDTGTNIRVVGNHLGGGKTDIDPVSSVIYRANTPSSENNEDETLTNILDYLGSISAQTTTPGYSNNFAGPQGEDLTARAAGLDLLLQWVYEERNFALVSPAEPMHLTWNSTVDPPNGVLSSTGDIHLVSAHRDNVWIISQNETQAIDDGYFLYCIIDRELSAETGDITLATATAPMGSFPLDITNAPGLEDNRQVFTLAFNYGGTLWWRGGGGTRFPAGQSGDYFVDGSSKSLLTYLGANDYNDSDPQYIQNFTGEEGESLTTRLAKTDVLIRRLFEHSNLGWYLDADTFFYSNSTGELDLDGTINFTLPHKTGVMYVTTQSFSWSLLDNDALYFSWDATDTADQEAVSTVASITAAAIMVDNHPPDIMHFVAAVRKGDIIHLWDGTRIPAGGRWPVQEGRQVVPVARPLSSVSTNYSGNTLSTTTVTFALTTGMLPGSLVTSSGGHFSPGTTVVNILSITEIEISLPALITATGVTITLSSPALTDNIVWDGTDVLWEGLAIACSTGTTPASNLFPDQLVIDSGLTTLAEGQGLLVTHTWVEQSPSTAYVTIGRVDLPLGLLEQNQFLWVQNRNGYLIF